MTAGMIVALAVAIPVMLFPAGLVWYLNIGGILATTKEAQRVKLAQKAARKA